jgi:hypothetical protein
MLNWNAELERDDVFVQLNEAVHHDCNKVKIFVSELPAFIDNRVSLVVFKKQLENYPKKIEFTTKNLKIIKLLKEVGFNAVLPDFQSENLRAKKEVEKPIREEDKNILPSIESFKFKEEIKPIQEEEKLGVFLKSMVIDSLENSDDKEPIVELLSNKIPLITVKNVEVRVGKRKEEKTIIKKINLEEYINSTRQEKLNHINNMNEGDFSKMSSILDGVIEDDFDELLTTLDKIKLNIAENSTPFYIKKPFRTLFSTGLCCFVVLGFTGYFNYIPSYAYRINVRNTSSIKRELIKVNQNLIKEKVLNLSIYSEQQVPKQKKEYFERAKGTVVLFSTGANSCTLTNGSFLVNNGDKYYRVLPNYIYGTYITIQSYSQSNPTLTFEVEALDKGPEMNVPKDTVLNLSTIFKLNLSKNCYAKTTTGINDYTIKENNIVTDEIVKNLQEYSAKAINEKVKEEIDDLEKQNIYTSMDWVESDTEKNLYNSKVGDVKDVVTLNRTESKKLKFLPLDVIESQIQASLNGDNRLVKNIKINSIKLENGLYNAEITYNLIDRSNIDKEKIKSLISKSSDTKEISEIIKKEFPNVSDVEKVNDGLNLPVLKKINVDVIDLY